MRENGQGILLEKAFSLLPEPVLPFAEAYRNLVKGRVEQVPVADMVAGSLLPALSRPGYPLLLPGERAGGAGEPVLEYLLALQNFDAKFPGFAHDTHGVERVNGEYRIFCIKEDP